MKFMYFRTPKQLKSGHGGVAIAYEVVDSSPESTIVAVVRAKCHNHDAFCKHHVRMILENRMRIGKEKGGRQTWKLDTCTLTKDAPLGHQLKNLYA